MALVRNGLMLNFAAEKKWHNWLWISAVVIVLDQITKQAIESRFVFGESLTITSFFNLVLAYNKGAAFSFLADAGGWQKWFFTFISVAASATSFRYMERAIIFRRSTSPIQPLRSAQYC
jgi:lipoprotein signal peptidase